MDTNTPDGAPLGVKVFLKKTTHGLSHTKVYNSWCAMMHRCFNEKCSNYHQYGARGIRVCKKWMDFLSFYNDMSPTWQAGLTLDRIDVNGNYCPENCRWADAITQANNRRNNRPITIDGVTKNLSQWSRFYGLFPQVFIDRMERGMLPKEAGLAPKPKAKLVSFNGETMEISKWSQKTGLSVFVIHARLNLGWTPEEALTTETRRHPKRHLTTAGG